MFKASQGYTGNSRTVWPTQTDLVFQREKGRGEEKEGAEKWAF